MRYRDILTLCRVAGYHNDETAFLRHYIGKPVSFTAARKAFVEGQRAKAKGVVCTCHDCTTEVRP